MACLDVSWFSRWSSELDAALDCLPDLEMCSRDLYRALTETPDRREKRIALVTEHGSPFAVIALRRQTRLTWAPSLQWLVPGPSFPVRPGKSVAALSALGRSIPVAWWRMDEPLPSIPGIRSLTTEPVFRMRLPCDREAFWRQTRYLRRIRNIRNRCSAFAWAINPPGGARWVIANWAAKWRVDGGLDGVVRDRIMVAEALEARGQHHTIALFDGDRMIAGSTNFAHRGELVAGTLYGDPAYRDHHVGVRTIDQTFSFAAERGFAAIDIGRGNTYKHQWAPEDGSLSTFVVAPGRLWRLQRIVALIRRSLPLPPSVGRPPELGQGNSRSTPLGPSPGAATPPPTAAWRRPPTAESHSRR